VIQPKSIIDWGCGKARTWEIFRKYLPTLTELLLYDPAKPEYSHYPDKKYDLLICTDVLEHIPAGDIPTTLREMLGFCHAAYFGVPTYLARNLLPDGSNPHITIKDPVWWQKRFAAASEVQMVPVIATIRQRILLQNDDLTGYFANSSEVRFSWVPRGDVFRENGIFDSIEEGEPCPIPSK
jgi:hypothetical protein